MKLSSENLPLLQAKISYKDVHYESGNLDYNTDFRSCGTSMRSAETSNRDNSSENNYYKFNLEKDTTTKDDFISLKLVCPIDNR
jgi:hypothetical protein